MVGIKSCVDFACTVKVLNQVVLCNANHFSYAHYIKLKVLPKLQHNTRLCEGAVHIKTYNAFLIHSQN